MDLDLLLTKLKHIGFERNQLDWMRSFLTGRQQRVVIDGAFSDTCLVTSGVPQGSVLGPLLFIIYINDIGDRLSPGTFIRLFADDALIYRFIRSFEDHLILQHITSYRMVPELENGIECFKMLRTTLHVTPPKA